MNPVICPFPPLTGPEPPLVVGYDTDRVEKEYMYVLPRTIVL